MKTDRYSFSILSRVVRTVLLVTCLLGQGNCSKADELKVGDYADEGYLALLSKSHSAALAVKVLLPQSIKIGKSKAEGEYILQAIYDFNEGGPVYSIKNGSASKLIEGVGQNPQFKRLDSDRVRFGFANHPPRTYRFVGDMNKFVSEHCLVGHYVGSKNENVVFSDGGDVFLNGEKKRYSVGLYFPPSLNRDYFILDSVEYGFTRIGDTLKIFDVKGGPLFEDGVMSVSPSMVLFRTQ